MLRATEITHLNRPEITAIFPVDRGQVLSFIYQILKAYDPMIRSIGNYSFITDVTGIGATINKLRSYVTDPSYHRGMVPEPSKGKEGAQAQVDSTDNRRLQDWEIVTEALAAGLYPQTDRQYLKDVTVSNKGTHLLAEMATWMKQGAVLTPTGKDFEYKPLMGKDSQITPEEAAFVRTALCLGFDSLVTSGYFVNVPARQEGVNKGTYERLMRGLRIVGAQVALVLSGRTLALRPYHILLKDPHVRERVLIEFGANAKNYIDMLDEMASLPMHPWHAMADCLEQPGRNLTPWGANTPTVGLDTYFLKSFLVNNPTPDAPIDPVVTVDWGRAFEYARRMKQEVRILREDAGLALDSAYAALRFTSVGPRPRIPLMGGELMPVHTDGIYATEPLGPLDMIYRPMLPARVWNQPMRWIGEPRLLSNLDLAELTHKPKLYIEPEDVPVMADYMLGRLSPSQLKPASAWQGEEDAIFTPLSVEGLSNLFGVSKADMEAEIGSPVSERWNKLFEQTNGKIESKSPDAVVYVSSATRRPSLRVVGEETGMVQGRVHTLFAMQYGLVIRAEQTKAQFVRDLDVPVPAYDISEKLRQFAAGLVSRQGAK